MHSCERDCVHLQAPKHPLVKSDEALKSFVTEPALW